MTIVTYHYRPKRAPRKKRKGPAIVSRIVTPAPLRPLKGPVIRLGAERPDPATSGIDTLPSEAARKTQEQPKRSAIVEPKRSRGPRSSVRRAT